MFWKVFSHSLNVFMKQQKYIRTQKPGRQKATLLRTSERERVHSSSTDYKVSKDKNLSSNNSWRVTSSVTCLSLCSCSKNIRICLLLLPDDATARFKMSCSVPNCCLHRFFLTHDLQRCSIGVVFEIMSLQNAKNVTKMSCLHAPY